MRKSVINNAYRTGFNNYFFFNMIAANFCVTAKGYTHSNESLLTDVFLCFQRNLQIFQIVFTDPRNKAIFTNSDFGKTIKRYMVDFTPSDVSFYEHDARTFLVLDKEDPERKVIWLILFVFFFYVW